MFDIGVTKLAIVGGIALIVIGPDKLPGLAKTLGALLGRARRYVADVKEEVNRSMDLDALKKMKEAVEGAGKEVENTIQTTSSEFEAQWSEAVQLAGEPLSEPYTTPYRNVKKRWRIKINVTPRWYKAREGLRTKALSGAARVARFRPPKVNP